MDNENKVLREQLEKQNKELIEARQTIERLTKDAIYTILNAVDLKDHYTKGHSNRVAEYSREIAKRMGKSKVEQREIYNAGLLHDVGKIGIDNAILNKKSGLTDAEYETMKLHPVMGYQVLKNITENTRMSDGAKWHHERFDGKGYPDGLSGYDIPEIARIIAVADVYDSLTSKRSYRKPMLQKQVREEIEKNKGSQFDPDIADIMLEMIDEDKDYKMQQLAKDKKHILIVDDDAMARKVTQSFFEDNDEYIASTASGADAALTRLNHQEIDLILLDIKMPKIDGFMTYKLIRAAGNQVPIVFMTSANDLESIEKARQLGAEDYITKPVKAQAVFEIIHAVLERSKQG